MNATTLQIGDTAITATATELNLVDGSSAGTIVNSKAVIYGSNGEVNATTLQIGGTAITATTAELNIIDGNTSVGTTAVSGGDAIVTNNNGTMRQTTVDTFDTYLSSTTKTLSNKTLTSPKINVIEFEGSTADEHETTFGVVDPTADRTVNIANASGTLIPFNAASTTVITSTPEELNILDGVTATTEELNILDGVTSTATELNLVDGSSAGTIVNSKAVIYGSNGRN